MHTHTHPHTQWSSHHSPGCSDHKKGHSTTETAESKQQAWTWAAPKPKVGQEPCARPIFMLRSNHAILLDLRRNGAHSQDPHDCFGGVALCSELKSAGSTLQALSHACISGLPIPELARVSRGGVLVPSRDGCRGLVDGTYEVPHLSPTRHHSLREQHRQSTCDSSTIRKTVARQCMGRCLRAWW